MYTRKNFLAFSLVLMFGALYGYVVGNPTSLNQDFKIHNEAAAGGAKTTIAKSADVASPQVAILAPVSAANLAGVVPIYYDGFDMPDTALVSPWEWTANVYAVSSEGVTMQIYTGYPGRRAEWDTATVPNGQYKIFVKGTDKAGNTFTSNPVEINVINGASVDSGVPTGVLIVPTARDTEYTKTNLDYVKAYANASVTPIMYLYDDIGVSVTKTPSPYGSIHDSTVTSGIDVIVEDPSGVISKSTSTIYKREYESGMYYTSWNVPSNAPEGSTYKMHAEFKDAAGNIGKTAVITITVDKTKPSVTSFGPIIKSGGKYSVTANATDSLSGVYSMLIYLRPANDPTTTITLGACTKATACTTTWDSTHYYFKSFPGGKIGVTVSDYAWNETSSEILYPY